MKNKILELLRRLWKKCYTPETEEESAVLFGIELSTGYYPTTFWFAFYFCMIGLYVIQDSKRVDGPTIYSVVAYILNVFLLMWVASCIRSAILDAYNSRNRIEKIVDILENAYNNHEALEERVKKLEKLQSDEKVT